VIRLSRDSCTTKWPKKHIVLSDEQFKIIEDWMPFWLKIYASKYNFIEKFNNTFVQKRSKNITGKTLEIGAGLGEHLNYEKNLDKNYIVMELREDMTRMIQERFPSITIITGDCQQKNEFEDNFFNRVIAIHVLEHLPDLPAALREIKRVLKKDEGRFYVVIPCEGGFFFNLARNLSSRRVFEKRYKTNFDLWIKYEHINSADEVINELLNEFILEDVEYFPFRLKSIQLNICLGMVLKTKPE
jgi:SAM-dependent methyltransferase